MPLKKDLVAGWGRWSFKHVAVPGFADLTIGRPWWEEKSVDHSEGSKTGIQDTVFNGLITRLLLGKSVLEKIKKKLRILPIKED